MTEISATTVEPAETDTHRYLIDGRSSRFTVRAFATGLLAAMGNDPTIHVRDLRGEINFNPEKLEANSLRIVVKSSSLSVQDDLSAKDLREIERLMNQEVLETITYPEISYASHPVFLTKMADMLYSVTIKGNLTLHGVSRNRPINVRIALLGTNATCFGEFSLNQTDYNIKLVSVAGGELRLKDELKFPSR